MFYFNALLIVLMPPPILVFFFFGGVVGVALPLTTVFGCTILRRALSARFLPSGIVDRRSGLLGAGLAFEAFFAFVANPLFLLFLGWVVKPFLAMFYF
jgi:hypothetical protein